MDGLLDFLHSMLPDSWFDNVSHVFGESLTDDVIAQSVQEASDFFNMNAPMEVHEDWTTGVMTGLPFTENDDILIFNREQMHNMGISDKEGFDLVMTHEGCHRALQGIETGFNDHQEELCCDYMAGVRAGLNGMDAGKMIASLEDTHESASHPGGAARINAVAIGVNFAHDYMQEHNGTPPSFSDCLDFFSHHTDFISAYAENGQVNLRQDMAAFKGFTQADVDWYEHQARISSGSEQAHWLKEAQWARNHIKGFVGEHSAHLGGQYGNATGDYIDDSHPEGGSRFDSLKGYTQADVDWFEHQARISSGSEQIHWLKEAQWARNHIHSFAEDAGVKQFSSAFASGFDDEHPMPSYDELRNAGFSDYLANQILHGDHHCYSQRELFNCLYNSENPVNAYNEMMEAKAQVAINKADKLINDIETQFGI